MQKGELPALGGLGFQAVFVMKHPTSKRQQISFQEHAKEV